MYLTLEKLVRDKYGKVGAVTKFAESMAMPYATVHYHIKGKTEPSFAVLHKYAAHFDVDIRDLFVVTLSVEEKRGARFSAFRADLKKLLLNYEIPTYDLSVELTPSLVVVRFTEPF